MTEYSLASDHTIFMLSGIYVRRNIPLRITKNVLAAEGRGGDSFE
jgi:hypothetical protein